MPNSGAWTTRGFEDFSQGTLGNAGQNLYVSRSGALQRIHQYDLNRDGYFDLVFCNSQNKGESPPAYVYLDPLGRPTRLELPSSGAMSGAVADFNGDGYDDLLFGMWHNGERTDLNAILYFGSATGWSERREQLLPAPHCMSAAAADFNGDGRPDLALLCRGKVRLFYQGPLGFEMKAFVDLDIAGDQLAAADLDGDGYVDLVVRTKDEQVRIFWGGPDGINPARISTVPQPAELAENTATPLPDELFFQEHIGDATPLPGIVQLHHTPHLFIPRLRSALLLPVTPDRSFGPAQVLACLRPMAIAAGDVDGDGVTDLVIACRQPHGSGECSWIYWGGAPGFSDARRTPLDSFRACDVAVADLDGDGAADIVLCQNHTAFSFTADSLVYRGNNARDFGPAVRLETHDARRVLLARPAPGALPALIFVNFHSNNSYGDIPISIYAGGPDGFSAERRQDLPGHDTVEALCCDLNNDGYVDVVLANSAHNSPNRDPGSFVYLNGPAGLPSKPSFRLPTRQAHGVACADLNRDGYLDLVFCSCTDPHLVIFYGTATGFDTANPVRIRLEDDGVLYKQSFWVYLADLNNNGWLDMVIPGRSDRTLILWGGPEGYSMARSQKLAFWHSLCARAADLDGDGYLDLVIGGDVPVVDAPHDCFVCIYWNGPDGLREDRRTFLPGNGILSMALADFNHDGLLDLYISSYSSGREREINSYIYWNRPGKGFSAADRQSLPTHSGTGCIAADFNEDGWVDLAIANHKFAGEHVTTSAVWWNGPQGFSAERQTPLPTSGPHGMVSVGPGNLVDRGPEEYYTSRPYQLPAGVAVSQIAWQADIPAKTWVKAQLRCAPSAASLASAAWQGPTGVDSWFENGQSVAGQPAAGAWVQYKLTLGATNSLSTPRVTQVKLSYG